MSNEDEHMHLLSRLLSKACFPNSLSVTNINSRRSIHPRQVIHTVYAPELLRGSRLTLIQPLHRHQRR